MKLLIIAEHDHHSLKNTTRHTITAAKKLSGDITILVFGKSCEAVAFDAQKIEGVSHVMLVDDAVYEHHLAENTAALIAKIGESFDGILAGGSTFSKNILPRVAALCDENMLSDVSEIIDPHTFVRPIYAGNALLTVRVEYKKLVATIRCPSFSAAPFLSEKKASFEKIECVIPNHSSTFVSEEQTKSNRPELTSARVIVSGGRGLKSKDQFQLIEELADLLGGAVGASRAAVDAGFAPNDYQVGQTGKTVSPDLYIAVGISGAIQHLAGIKDSKVIVAINNDPDAPIFKASDYGIIGDLFVILPEIKAELSKS